MKLWIQEQGFLPNCTLAIPLAPPVPAAFPPAPFSPPDGLLARPPGASPWFARPASTTKKHEREKESLEGDSRDLTCVPSCCHMSPTVHALAPAASPRKTACAERFGWAVGSDCCYLLLFTSAFPSPVLGPRLPSSSSTVVPHGDSHKNPM